MNCFAIKPDNELLMATAPGSVMQKILDENTDSLVLAGLHDEKMVCYAVFIHQNTASRSVWLTWLYTAPSYREQGIATDLLSFADDYLKRKGVTDILVRLLTEPETAQEFLHYFKSRGYLPLSLTGRCLIYRYEDMLDPGIFEFLEKRKSKLPPILHFKDIDRRQLALLPIEFTEEDEEFSCFIKEADRICGAAVACPVEGGTGPGDEGHPTVCIREIWLDEAARKKGMFLPLLAAVCDETSELLSRELWIHLYLKDDAAYHGLFQMFNPPEEEYLVQEYMKKLIERE